MAAVVNIASRYGLSIDACLRNQPNMSEIVLYKAIIYINSCLKQLCICKISDIKVSVVYVGVHVSRH